MLASLNHPNIAAIYGLEEADRTNALVLELVEGPTLADRIARGAVPLAEALPIAKQVAEALDAAHEQGIVHRDLKPASIKLRPDGTVKVLDFGLAKAMEPASSANVDMTHSPTITSPAMTQAGIILGTAAYMSPEQAAGKPVDKRSDLWAFGVVFLEMLVGRQIFEGETVSHVLAGILAKEPDWTALPASTPPGVRRLLRRCLEKDRRKRLADAADARIEIEEAMAPAAVEVSSAAPVAGVGRRTPPWAVAGGAVVVLGAGLAVGLWAPWRRPPSPPAPLRLQVDLGADVTLVANQGASAVLSPDGGTLVFAGQQSAGDEPRLYVRRLDQLHAVALAGTERAQAPFFSPDGQWVAFFADSRLKKISLGGGAVVTLCDAPAHRGGSWGVDGTITFHGHVDPADPEQLVRVSSAGGKAELLFKPREGEGGAGRQTWPQALPGGKAVLYSLVGSSSDDDGSLAVADLSSGTSKVIHKGGYFGRYLSSGHVAYIHQGTLFALPFDLARLEVTGPPVPALEHIRANANNGGAQVAISDTGTIAYVSGTTERSDAPIQWVDRTGRTTSLRTTASNWTNPSFSPDGRQLAMDLSDGRQTDVWLYEWSRDILSRLTFSPVDDLAPVWTPDSRRIAFASARTDGGGAKPLNLHWQRADGTGEVQRLTESDNIQIPTSWHPSGRLLAFSERDPKRNYDLMILPVEGDEASGWKIGKPTAFLGTPFGEQGGIFSPDGRWIAYASNESGRMELYVRPFPGPGGKWQISSGGAAWNPRWSRTRHELLYTEGTRIMVVPYATEGDSFRAEKPRPWGDVSVEGRPRAPSFDFDLHPDGERIAHQPEVSRPNAAQPDRLVFIFNFIDELRRLSGAPR